VTWSANQCELLSGRIRSTVVAVVVVVLMMIVVAIIMVIIMMLVGMIVMTIIAVILTVGVFVVIVMTSVIMMLVVPFLPSHVPRLVFGGPHEVHATVTCMIFVAVAVPVARVIRRHMQVNRLEVGCLRRRLFDDHGLRVYECWTRPVREIYTPVDTGCDFTGDCYRYAQVSRTGKGRHNGKPESREERITNRLDH
jgi:hypothetical protein